MPDETFTILGISGSLRNGSYNTLALKAAQEVVPDGITLDILPLADIPLYNEDVYSQGFPPPVQILRSRIAAADALLIATPEYNYSIPGVLKNAIDWASRPPDQPFQGKPIGLVSASPAWTGGARAQYHLRQCFIYLNGLILNQPEVMISTAHEKFDSDGRLTDERAREQLRTLLSSLQAWSRQLTSK